MFHLCSENRDADQLRSYCASDLSLLFSHMQKSRFSRNAAYLCVVHQILLSSLN